MREDNYIGFFNLSSVHITGLDSSSFSFMNCDPLLLIGLCICRDSPGTNVTKNFKL